MQTHKIFTSYVIAGALALALGAACGVEQPTAEQGSRPLDACLSGGEALGEVVRVDNNSVVAHGTTTAFALTDLGEALIAATDGSIKLWDLESGARQDLIDPIGGGGLYGEIAGSGNPVVSALAVTPDGGFIVAGDVDGGLRFFDRSTIGTTPAALGEIAVKAIAITDDGAVVAAADDSFGGNVRVWSITGGSITPALTTMLWGVDALQFLPDGRLVISGHIYGDPAIEIRAAADPSVTEGVWTVREGLGAVRAVAVSPDDGSVVGVGAGFAIVLPGADTDAGQLLYLDAAHGPRSVAVTGDHFVTVGDDGTVRGWDLQDGAERLRVAQPAALTVRALSATDRLVVAESGGNVVAQACRP